MSRYKPYPKYKDSGVEWLGEVPEHWMYKRLKYYARIKNGQDQKKVLSDDGQFPVYGSGGEFGRADEYLYNKESVLLGRKGTIDKPLFIVEPFWTVDTMYYTVIFKTTFPKFFYYACLTIKFDYYQCGSAVPSMTQENLHSTYFAYPPYEEQIVIANFLDNATCKIDTLIQKQQNLIELLKEKRQTAVENIILQDKIVSMRLGMVVDQIFRPVDRKMEEVYVALGLYNRGRGLFHKEPKEGSELGDSDFYWIQDGDLILSGQFAWEGAVALARESENNCIVSHRYPVLRGKENIINTEYLWAFLTTKTGDFILNENSVGSAGRNRPLNINTLMKEKIPIPNFAAQLKISRIVQIEKKISESVAKTIEILKERRTALISATVTGKIDARGIAS